MRETTTAEPANDLVDITEDYVAAYDAARNRVGMHDILDLPEALAGALIGLKARKAEPATTVANAVEIALASVAARAPSMAQGI